MNRELLYRFLVFLRAMQLHRQEQQRLQAAEDAARIPIARAIPFERASVVDYVKQAATDQVVDQAIDAIGQKAVLAAGAGAAGIGAAAEASLASLSAAAPAASLATVAGGLAIAAVDIFGGGVDIPTYATTPQLDATTALGQAAGRKRAALIRQNLAAGVGKFGDVLDPFAF